ncbi:MAG: HAMP domain-containing histidine kinase [Methylocystis sp.]|nr:HAMP domain-containing histidine kinase [Methylocystis sp.]
MLIATRLDAHQAALDQCVDLVVVARTIVGDYAPLAFQAGRALVFETATSEVVIRGNRQAIECVVVNLVDNALRAEPSGGAVIVRVREGGVVEVADHGPGVEEQDRERIFEPFWRKSDSTSGVGLGLAIAKDIVDAHGGKISVEKTPGGGATFKLCFAVSAPR